MNVSLTPCSFSTRSRILSRRALTADMSISLNVVRCAVLCCDCRRFSAIRLRRVDIFSRVSRSPSEDGAPARIAGGDGARGDVGDAGDAAGAAAGAGGAGARSRTSGLLTTPPRPVPVTPATSIPEAAATRRAAGDDLTSPSPDGVLGGTGPAAGAAAAATVWEE